MRLRAARALSNVLINLSRSRPSIVFYDLLGVNSEAHSSLSLTIPLLLVDSSYVSALCVLNKEELKQTEKPGPPQKRSTC